MCMQFFDIHNFKIVVYYGYVSGDVSSLGAGINAVSK